MRSLGLIGRTAISAVVGGTASVIGGGKFANGAQTAAFAHLLNAELSAAQRIKDITLRTKIDAMNLLRNKEGYTSHDFTSDFPQFKGEPNIYTKQRIGQLSSDIGNLHFPDALEYAKDVRSILMGVATLGKPLTGMKAISPNIARQSGLGALYNRYRQNQPDTNFTPREYIKISGDYIYGQ